MNNKIIVVLFALIASCQQKEPAQDKFVPLEDVKKLPAAHYALRSTPEPKKFEKSISFSNYPAHAYKGGKARIAYGSHRLASLYRTAISTTYQKEGLNFGGHYSIAVWGCGSPCKGGAMVDLITGKVYELPYAGTDYQFKRDSRLLVINPPDSSGYYDSNCSFCTPALWYWDEGKKIFVEL